MIDAVSTWIAASQRIVVLTGAGISTDSGIPDFRGPQGVWTKDPQAEKQATLQHYVADPEVRRRAWRARLESPAWEAKPNDGHKALVTLERRGRLDTLITQNVDGLHQLAGSSPEKVTARCARSSASSAASARRWSGRSRACGPGRTIRRAFPVMASSSRRRSRSARASWPTISRAPPRRRGART